MLLVLGAALALHAQIQIGPSSPRTPVVRDSMGIDSGRAGRSSRRGARQPVTAEDQRSAFKDPLARTTLLQARVARMSMDSALTSYDAMSYSRVSAGMSFLKMGRDRLLFRHESAARVRWQQGVGVWMDIKGKRTTIPAAPDEAREEIRQETNDPDMNASIPYFPGYEPLWVGSGMARSQVNDKELVNPIADGAEAYYTYETGDSVRFTLPNGATILLRELKVRPRVSKWNLAVGSLWFDTKSGQLVRAAYRLSVTMDIWAVAQIEDTTAMKDVPTWVKPMITPMKADVSTIAVEYGLHEGRFWLPRLRLAEGTAQVSFMHVPFKMEESFKYASVNGKDPLPAIPEAVGVLAPVVRVRMPDSLSVEQQQQWRDSVRLATRARTRASVDSIRLGLKTVPRRSSQCDTSDTRVGLTNRYGGDLKIAVRTPCNLAALEHSPDLPASIYDDGEELFGDKELELLKQEALSLSAQGPLQLRLALMPPPTVQYGLSMTRYNRVEGLSLGASIEQQAGGGYSGLAIGRIGLADREPNIELSVTRTNMTDAVTLSLYNRLVSASDWGHPLSFGSSFSALMFGRDEGFYYRASGLSFGGGRQSSFGGGTRLEWRTFAERQRSATPHASFSMNGSDFPANLVATRATYVGLEGRAYRESGLDPRGMRLITDARAEVARGDSVYGRAAMDFTASHGLGEWLAGSLTLSGGTSVGGLPAQRNWYLGGSQTVRGQSPDVTQSGNAFWLTRTELGSNYVGLRPTVFTDIGWVGDRADWGNVGRPMSGAGVGVSFMDGLFRFDVARGIYPRKQFRVDLYLESKF
ncbi:MAG: ShlB/FhaC/HecB family hemolysin secretion/activation protein [Gemmatimonadota bacterium]